MKNGATLDIERSFGVIAKEDDLALGRPAITPCVATLVGGPARTGQASRKSVDEAALERQQLLTGGGGAPATLELSRQPHSEDAAVSLRSSLGDRAHIPSRPTLAERLADEAPLAVGTVLFRAHDSLRHVENTLELEAADPRVAELYGQAKTLRKSLAALLVEVAADAVEIDGRRTAVPGVLETDEGVVPAR